jgi:putative acetyltransferase
MIGLDEPARLSHHRPMVTLRPRDAADLPRLFAIWAAAVRATHQFLTAEDFAFYAEQVQHLYLPLANLEVVEHDGAVAGFLGLEDAKVDALFLDPAYQRQGVGRAVMAEVFRRFPRVTLDVNAQNEGARAFYSTLGFHEVGRSATDAAGKPYPIIHLARGPSAPP